MSALFWQLIFASLGYWFAAPLALLLLFAKLRGDKPVRALSSVMALGALAGAVLGPARHGITPANLLIDSASLAVQVVICIRAQRLYPVFCAAAQLLIVQVELLACSGFPPRDSTTGILATALALVQFSAFGLGLVRYRSKRPLWQVRARRENASGELAPRVNDAR